jgi:GT2 family glycosyltransferase
MNLKIAVLVLGYNHRDTLKDMLDSVLKQEYPNYAVTYIDNDSWDGSVDFVRCYYPIVSVITNRQNLGYAGGYDAVIRDAFAQGFDAVVLLNPDTIADKDWLTELVKSAYVAPDIALAQSKVLIWNDGPTDLINTYGNNVHFLGFGHCGHYKEQDRFLVDSDVTYASGSSLLIKKEYYPSKISFDTDFFAYLEDQDLGWQARVQGLRAIASAKSKVWHKYDFQKKKLDNLKFYLLERNRLFYLTKFWSFRLFCLVFPFFIIMEIGVLFDSILKGYFSRKMKAYWDYSLSIPKLYRKRIWIQRNRTVSDKELFCLLSPTIDFEEVDSPLLRLANSSMKKYYTIIQQFL